MTKIKQRKYYIPMLKWLWNKNTSIVSKIEAWQNKKGREIPSKIFEILSTIVIIIIGIPIIYIIAKVRLIFHV